MATTAKSDLAARAAAVIPGGVNSGQRRVPGLEELVIAATARSVGLMGVGVTEIEVELAERICELVPSAERALLTETGSEATFHALRVARAATGRRHVIKFQGC